MEASTYQDSALLGVEIDEQFNFKCKFCFKNLSSRQNLREHMYIHTGEKPYACNEPGCEQKFRQGSLLSIHKKIHKEVRRNRGEGKKIERRCVYPKLTELIPIVNHSVDLPLEILEKQEWISKIGSQEFLFLSKYLALKSH
ncbi:hypothetical protein SteCoe_27913 [Stentor coeruleus]|uniref:C2H2-type domain-containing protein n=1 Tax=Stentor coeruleus TaxID=5963 RepID=A0A1R2B9G0_9CILI|nr:hypothetical protein SteCoe_27913 [Stentor coeruleus]